MDRYVILVMFACHHPGRRNLMAEEELDTLGLGEKGEYIRVAPVVGEKERYGFTAGMYICVLKLVSQ